MVVLELQGMDGDTIWECEDVDMGMGECGYGNVNAQTCELANVDMGMGECGYGNGSIMGE